MNSHSQGIYLKIKPIFISYRLLESLSVSLKEKDKHHLLVIDCWSMPKQTSSMRTSLNQERHREVQRIYWNPLFSSAPRFAGIKLKALFLLYGLWRFYYHLFAPSYCPFEQITSNLHSCQFYLFMHWPSATCYCSCSSGCSGSSSAEAKKLVKFTIESSLSLIASCSGTHWSFFNALSNFSFLNWVRFLETTHRSHSCQELGIWTSISSSLSTSR